MAGCTRQLDVTPSVLRTAVPTTTATSYMLLLLLLLLLPPPPPPPPPPPLLLLPPPPPPQQQLLKLPAVAPRDGAVRSARDACAALHTGIAAARERKQFLQPAAHF